MRHAGTAATHSPVVPADEPAVGPLPDLSRWLGRSGSVVTSPARRCAVAGAESDPRLGPWDLGEWVGQPFDQLDLAGWRADPGYDVHGGESLLALADRAAALLAGWHDHSGRLVAVTHAALIKALVVQALNAPLVAVWDIDVLPGSVTELHATPQGWRLTRLSCRQP